MKVYNEKPNLRAPTIQCECLGKSVSDTISGKEKVTPKAKVTWSKLVPHVPYMEGESKINQFQIRYIFNTHLLLTNMLLILGGIRPPHCRESVCAYLPCGSLAGQNIHVSGKV
uniref:Uncharacterized protein n=1 Tax=Anopheles merus TaxID=30066 RepID=A0A182VEV5_ANOME